MSAILPHLASRVCFPCLRQHKGRSRAVPLPLVVVVRRSTTWRKCWREPMREYCMVMAATSIFTQRSWATGCDGYLPLSLLWSIANLRLPCFAATMVSTNLLLLLRLPANFALTVQVDLFKECDFHVFCYACSQVWVVVSSCSNCFQSPSNTQGNKH